MGAPTVRRIAIADPLSFTIIMRLEIILKAATKTMSITIKNITFFCTFKAEKIEWFSSCQSKISKSKFKLSLIDWRGTCILSGLLTKTSILETLSPKRK